MLFLLVLNQGSSAYNEHVQATLSDLIEKGLVRDVENIGQMMQIGETQLPLVDKDGGYRQTATHNLYSVSTFYGMFHLFGFFAVWKCWDSCLFFAGNDWSMRRSDG